MLFYFVSPHNNINFFSWSQQMKALRIEGPSKISGTIIPGGNKNAALPIIAACLLTEEEVLIHNMPEIVDVRIMLEIAEYCGATVERNGKDVKICARNIVRSDLPASLCGKVRTSILFAGALTYRCGSAKIGRSGGDVIGRRRLDSHYYGLRKLGIETVISNSGSEFKMARKNLTASDMFLDEASVTGTEQIMIAAAVSKGTTIIRNAASEPHIQQLGELLQLMGAKVEGLDTNTLYITGSNHLHGAEYTIDSDHIEVASFMSLAAATRGGVEFEGKIRTHHYWMMRRIFTDRFGIHFKLHPNHIVMPAGQRMKVHGDIGNAIPVISDGPWPQFPSDMMSCLLVAATQAKGTTLFFEKMFESRIYFVDRLIAMGANAIICDPHRAVIAGPSKLHAIEMASPDIRAGMALVLAACCAKGTSIVNNADMIYRGYENLVEKLRLLGVNVTELDRK